MHQKPSNRRLSSAAFGTALASIFPFSAAAQEMLTPMPDDAFESVAYSVSADGLVVVGNGTFPGGLSGTDVAVSWTEEGGFVELSNDRSDARGVSADGSVIVGYVGEHGATEAFRWTEDGGLVKLGVLGGGTYSEAFGVSADGSIVVGRSIDGGNLSTAFIWSETDGMLALDPLPGGSQSRAWGISGDGLVVVGQSNSATSGPWQEAVLWNETDGVVELGKLNNSDSSSARAASHDGSVVVGWAVDGDAMQQRGFRWTEVGGMESLGTLNGGSYSLAYDVSDDGLVIVGSSTDGNASNVSRGFRWTEESGMQSVEDWLRDAGADIAEDTTRNAYGISADGAVVVGDTHDNGMYIARSGFEGSGDGDGAGGGDAGGDGAGGGTGGGTGGGAGMITIDDLAASLSGTGGANSTATNAMGTLLNGAGSRPLDRRAPEDKSIAWIGGDWGRDDHGARHGDVKLGELGVGYNFGAIQVNGVFGLNGLDQKTLLGGRTDVDSEYAKLEVLMPLQATDRSGLWFAVTGTALWGDADIRRNYIANGGLVNTSRGRTDVDGYALRGRVQWENLTQHISPYGEVSHARVCLDGYVEAGGAFPAAFDKLCEKATEARLGVDTRLPLAEGFRLIGTVEGVHRFQSKGAAVTGQVIGLGAFNLGRRNYQQNWVRGGAGLELDIAGSTLSVMANGTSKGESANAWLAASWRVNF